MPVASKVQCTVDRLIDHGRRVYTVDLLPDRQIPRFLPGQFLHLALDPYSPSAFWPDSRPFSIASSPLNRTSLRITYSVVGKFTTRMEKELHEGSRVWVKMPYGDFVVRGTRPTVLFAGGTGITAFAAFLQNLEPESEARITLFYGARNWPLLTYYDLVERARQRTSGLRLYLYCEEPGPPGAPFQVDGLGRLSVEAAWSFIPEPLASDYFLSGPPAMLQSLQHDLAARHVPAEQTHVDAW